MSRRGQAGAAPVRDEILNVLLKGKTDHEAEVLMSMFNGRKADHEVKVLDAIVKAREAEIASLAPWLLHKSKSLPERAEAATAAARAGDSDAAGYALMLAGTILELNGAMPDSLRVYLGEALVAAGAAYQDFHYPPEGKSEAGDTRHLARLILEALNLTPGMGRPQKPIEDDGRLAVAWARLRDEGASYQEAVTGAAKQCSASEAVVVRAVRRFTRT